MRSLTDLAAGLFHQPRPQPFTERSIRVVTPGASGVYRIYDDLGVLLWVGESDDLQRRLLEHLHDPAMRRYQPNHFEYDLVPESARMAEEAHQILTRRPVLNLNRPAR